MRKGGGSEEGVILVNVLLFVALASAVVALMIAAGDAALHRSSRLADASRARAAALGGETSAIVALRRDALVGAASDDATEPWAKLTTRDAPIRGGSFTLLIADASDRLNVNRLAGTDPGAAQVASRIATALRLPPDLLPRVTALLRLAGPVSDLSLLGLSGLPPETTSRLSSLVTALPAGDRINLNSVTEPLLAVLLDDPMKAHGLIEIRNRKGRLEPDDIAALGITLPDAVGYTSDVFWVRTRVRMGDTRQELTSLLLRKKVGTDIAVLPIGRWWGSAAPSQAPALP